MTSPKNPQLSKQIVFLNFLALLFATVFFSSTFPVRLIKSIRGNIFGQNLIERRWTGSGFLGTCWGVLTVLLVPRSVSQSIFWLFWGVLFSVLVAGRAEKIYGVHDDTRIIIDEWVGTWVAMIGLEPRLTMPVLVAAFLFRLFDVLKAPWVMILQKLPGGWGITLDDVVAGALANLVTRLIFC